MNVLNNNRYKQNGSREKTLGAVYTPPRVAAALARWAVRSPNDSVLDPACGDGVFLATARTRLADLGNFQPVCLGIDIDPAAATISGAVCEDFFRWASDAPTFDVIVGNPPFIRSHLFPEQSRQLAFEQMEEMGLHPSRLMSTWAPFVAVSCKLLSPTGRLALVVPEEILHVSYAQELRSFLLSKFRRVVVCFPTFGVFPSVQQTVVLLLCDNEPGSPSGLFSMRFNVLEDGTPYIYEPAIPWPWSTKWTHLFLSQGERQVISDSFEQLPWKPFKNFGRVEVGVVTGFNEFFTIGKVLAQELGSIHLESIITSAKDLAGISLSHSDMAHLSEIGRPTYVIHADKPVDQLPKALRNYLERGVQLGINNRYKCRNREPWYAIPSIWPADALLLRQAGEFPRLIHLSQPCASTDTIHRVRWRKPEVSKRLAVGFFNTWTLIACELSGRSYGGGVLELMPSEANKLPMPEPVPELEAIFDSVDELVRQRRFSQAISIVDQVVIPPSIIPDQLVNVREILSTLVTRRKLKNGRH